MLYRTTEHRAVGWIGLDWIEGKAKGVYKNGGLGKWGGDMEQNETKMKKRKEGKLNQINAKKAYCYFYFFIMINKINYTSSSRSSRSISGMRT